MFMARSAISIMLDQARTSELLYRYILPRYLASISFLFNIDNYMMMETVHRLGIDIDIDNIVAIKIVLTSLSKAIDIPDPPWHQRLTADIDSIGA